MNLVMVDGILAITLVDECRMVKLGEGIPSKVVIDGSAFQSLNI